MDGTEVILVSGLLKGLSLFTMRGICWPMYLRITLFIVTVLITVSTLAYIFDKIDHFRYIQIMGIALLTYSSVWFYYVAMYERPDDHTDTEDTELSLDSVDYTNEASANLSIINETESQTTTDHLAVPGTVYISLETLKSLDVYGQITELTEPKIDVEEVGSTAFDTTEREE